MAEPCKHSWLSSFQPLLDLQCQTCRAGWRAVRGWQPSWQRARPPGPLTSLSWHGAGGCWATAKQEVWAQRDTQSPQPKESGLEGQSQVTLGPRPAFLACTSLQANGLPRFRSREEEDWIASQGRHYLQHGLIKTTQISFFNLSYWERINDSE